jgi:5-methylcytosine-specific restriction endonuclease McrA
MKKIDLDAAIWGRSEPKRKPVKQSERTKVLVRAQGKCEKCRNSLEGLKPNIHHIDGNPKNNKLSNLKVLCPNCHSKAHNKPIKKKTGTDGTGSIFGVKSPFSF